MIGSKIIVVCDAVDAMLSDRPYRAALPPDRVLEELRENAGRQFDRNVVQVLTASDILANYTRSMLLERQRSEAESGSLMGIPDAPASVKLPVVRPDRGSFQYH